METILAFFAGYLLNWVAFTVLIIFGILSEHNGSHGWAVFWGLVAVAICYFMLQIPVTALAIAVPVYLIIGFIWSFWRYKRHCDQVVADAKDASDSYKERALALLQPRNMVNKITTWVLIWPFSAVENLIGDFVNMIQTAIATYFKGIYNRIFENASSQLLASTENGK